MKNAKLKIWAMATSTWFFFAIACHAATNHTPVNADGLPVPTAASGMSLTNMHLAVSNMQWQIDALKMTVAQLAVKINATNANNQLGGFVSNVGIGTNASAETKLSLFGPDHLIMAY